MSDLPTPDHADYKSRAADDNDGRHWAQRLLHDPTLQAFVSAEIARAGIRLDTLEYQNQYLRRDVGTLKQQLAHAELIIKRLRRQRAKLPVDSESV